MPGYPFLAKRDLSTVETDARMKAQSMIGVPYTEEMIASAQDDIATQANPNGETSGLEERYHGVIIRDFDGDPDRVTELDALVAYLQMLGTLVDFDLYQADENDNNR